MLRDGLPCELKWIPCSEWVFMQCRLCRSRLSLAVLSAAARAQRRPSAEWVSCNAGKAGTVSAVTCSPFYSSSCSEMACTANSDGDHVPSACSCNAGCTETVSSEKSSLQQLMPRIACPAKSNGDHVPGGCSCNAGYAGTVSAVTTSPFHNNSFSEIACPANSNADHVPSGCSCNAGYADTVSTVTSSPFYSSSCSELPALRTELETRCRLGVYAIQDMQALSRLSLSVLSTAAQAQRSPCPANSDRDHCPCNAGYEALGQLSPAVLSDTAHIQRMPALRTQMETMRAVGVQCGLCRHCVGCH
jgi:hypothetical protein